MRLWSSGTVFESRSADEGGLRIEENLKSGVELFGVSDISAEMELLALLFEGLSTLELTANHQPKLLIGHTELIDLILEPISKKVSLFVDIRPPSPPHVVIFVE